MKELPKNYDSKEAEPRILDFWKDKKVFQFDSNRPMFKIDTPPPTVSGNMHIGHAFSYTQQDFMARFKRQNGFGVFYPFGTDDNGLPTERLVEKMKNVKGVKMDRSEFIKLCARTVEEIKPAFVKDWIEIGMSCDFDESYSTISDHSIKTSQLSFIDLAKKERMTRSENPTIWCTLCQTAIAQAEIDDMEGEANFSYINFESGGKPITIATTRPELIPACVALMVNPEDERYKSLIGKHAKVPLLNYEIPVIGDEKVLMDKGTGAVMCCTFGDKTDIEWWRQYRLPLKIIINRDGTYNEHAGPYKGMKLQDGRAKIIEDIKKEGLLVEQRKITHSVGVHERCGTSVNFIVTKQWFIKVLDRKQDFLDVAEKIRWHPEHMKSRYVHWVENLQWDWCISRQRFFGVPIPVWYCTKCGETKYAEESQLPVFPTDDKPSSACECGSNDFEPELDVMDTWATSSVTPFIISNWAESKKDFEMLFPQQLRPQAHDIIRTWAFYTIVKSLYHTGKAPWENIMISGHVLDPKGDKMSKSKGNVIAPQDILKKYSRDSLRYWASGSSLGDDIRYSEQEFIRGTKLTTKLWNAGKLVMMNLEGFEKQEKVRLTELDKWLMSKYAEAIKAATEHYESYEYAKARLAIEQFFWGTFCDNYLEMVKDRFYNKERYEKWEIDSAQYALYNVYIGVIKMLAPIMPFITEEMYQIFFKDHDKEESIHVSAWPKVKDFWLNPTEAGDAAIDAINIIRNYKSENKMSLATELNNATIITDKERIEGLTRFEREIKSTMKIKKVILTEGKSNTSSLSDLAAIKIEIE